MLLSVAGTQALEALFSDYDSEHIITHTEPQIPSPHNWVSKIHPVGTDTKVSRDTEIVFVSTQHVESTQKAALI